MELQQSKKKPRPADRHSSDAEADSEVTVPSNHPVVDAKPFQDTADAPEGHVAWKKVRYDANLKRASFNYEGAPLQTTLSKTKTQAQAERICRLCWLRFEAGYAKDQVLQYRQECYERLEAGVALEATISEAQGSQDDERKVKRGRADEREVAPADTKANMDKGGKAEKAVPDKQAPTRFTIELRKRKGEGVGATFRKLSDGDLRVIVIEIGGLVYQWNNREPSRAVKLGDRLIAINEESVSEPSFHHIISLESVRMTFEVAYHLMHLLNGGTPRTHEEKIECLVKGWHRRYYGKQVVLMVGAGVSVSAGLPDFRNKQDGVYATIAREYGVTNPEALFSKEGFSANPERFNTWLKRFLEVREAAVPTVTHLFFKLLENNNRLLRCYTQNFDWLEASAGLSHDRIVMFHGNLMSAMCIACGKAFPFDDYQKKIRLSQNPMCTCGKLIRPDITLFNEQPHMGDRIEEDLQRCDLLIIAGTSLTVLPFAHMACKVNPGCPRLLINKEWAQIRDCDPRNHQLSFDNDSRDIFMEGCCDDSVRDLARRLGWDADLTRLEMEQMAEVAERTHSREVELLHARVAKLEQQENSQQEELRMRADKLELRSAELDEASHAREQLIERHVLEISRLKTECSQQLAERQHLLERCQQLAEAKLQRVESEATASQEMLRQEHSAELEAAKAEHDRLEQDLNSARAELHVERKHNKKLAARSRRRRE